MSTLEVVSPSAVSMPGADTVSLSSDVLSPCPSCGVDQKDAPEGTDRDGNAVWQNEHCHKCGFRPGHNVADKMHELKAKFAAFMEWNNSKVAEIAATPAGALSLTAPEDAEKVALRAQLAELKAQFAADQRSISAAPEAATDAAPDGR